MNYSPNNEQGLLSLIQALQNGLDPTVGYGLLGDIQNQQASMIDQRQQRLQGLSDLLMNAATQGMPYEGAQSLLEAAPGPAGPAAQNILSSLYPGADAPPATNANGDVMDFPTGSRAEVQSGGFGSPAMAGAGNPYAGVGAAPTGPNMTSPAYVPPPPDPAAQQAQMEMAQASADSANWGVFQQAMAQARAKNMDAQSAYMAFVQASPDNAALVSADPSRVKGIMTATFGQAALLGQVNVGN